MKKLFTLLTLCLLSLSVLANKTVSGTVVDEKGEPVIGASIQVEGTTLGTISDNNGKFDISVPDDAKTLIVSFIGMTPQKVAIKKNMDIVLSDNAELLEEVVITGYGTAKKGTYAGSAQAVKADDIEKKSPTELSKAMTGEVSGMSVINTSGQPGSSAMIRIRGYGSINASSAPLYVVDGIPYDGDVSAIDPGDIASVTVLKDATATSLYGNRGANGVILITTKKGTSGETGKIDVDVKYGVNAHFLPMYEVIKDPQEYVEMAWRAIYNSAGSSYTTEDKKIQAVNKQLFSAHGLPEAYNLWDKAGNALVNGYTGHFYDGINMKDCYKNMTSWEDAIFRVGQKAEASVKISGGSEKTTYFTSFSYLKDEGYYIGSDFNRFTARTNVDYQPKSWLKGGINLAYTYSTMNAPGQGSNMNNGFAYVNGIPPIYPVHLYNADGSIMIDPKTGDYAYDYGMNEGYGRYFGAGINPAGALRYDKNNQVTHQVTGNTYLEFKFGQKKFLKDLKLTVNVGMQYLGVQASQLTNPYYGDAAGIGRILKENDNVIALTANQLLEYNKTIDDHSIHAMVGHESGFQRVSYLYGYKSHLADPNSIELGNAVQISSTSSNTQEYAMESVLANFTYSYNDRYYLTANYRLDGSSKFAKGHQWGNFGSVGGGWTFTNEEFMPSEFKEWIKNGKLRLSWGVLGNQEIGSNLFADRYEIEYVDGEVAYVWNYKGNPEITWEKTSQWDLGLEFSLKKYLDVEIDYYHKLTSNMFFPRYTAPSLGYSAIWVSDGQMSNQGVEFDFKAHVVDKNKVKFDIHFNGARNWNRVVKLPKNLDESGSDKEMMYGSLAEGHDYFEYNMIEYLGVDPEDGQALYKGYYDADLGSFGTGYSANERRLRNEKGDNYITNVHQYLLDHPDANVQTTSTTAAYRAGSNWTGKSALALLDGGIGFDLEVYGVSLSATCSYRIGGYGYDASYNMLMATDQTVGSYNYHVDMRNAWTADNTNTNIPRMSNGSDTYGSYTSTRFLTSNSFFSLNNIHLGYIFPKKLSEKIKLNRLEIYASADNLALASARKGYNPMASYTGTSNAYQYTPLSTIMGGIKFQF